MHRQPGANHPYAEIGRNVSAAQASDEISIQGAAIIHARIAGLDTFNQPFIRGPIIRFGQD
jgi:hypothetical protein